MNEEKGKDSQDLENGKRKGSPTTLKEGERRRKYLRKGVGLAAYKNERRKNEKRRNNKRGKKGDPAKFAVPHPEGIRIYMNLWIRIQLLKLISNLEKSMIKDPQNYLFYFLLFFLPRTQPCQQFKIFYGGIKIKEELYLILNCGSLKLRIKVQTRIQTFWEMLDPNPDLCSKQ